MVRPRNPVNQTNNTTEEKTVELDTKSTLIHTALGTFQDPGTKKWFMAVVSFNGLTGEARVTDIKQAGDDRYEAVERMKITFVEMDLV